MHMRITSSCVSRNVNNKVDKNLLAQLIEILKCSCFKLGKVDKFRIKC